MKDIKEDLNPRITCKARNIFLIQHLLLYFHAVLLKLHHFVQFLEQRAADCKFLILNVLFSNRSWLRCPLLSDKCHVKRNKNVSSYIETCLFFKGMRRLINLPHCDTPGGCAPMNSKTSGNWLLVGLWICCGVIDTFFATPEKTCVRLWFRATSSFTSLDSSDHSN